jgi:hypothetical protein
VPLREFDLMPGTYTVIARIGDQIVTQSFIIAEGAR